MTFTKHIPSSILKIVKIYGAAIVIFTLFRGGLLLAQWSSQSANLKASEVLKAFIMGWRFDTVIASYFLALPFLLLTIGLFTPKLERGLTHITKWIILLLFTFGFGISAADIPYFNQFFSRFSVAAFEWMDSHVFVFKMIFQEPKYGLFILPFLAVVFVFYRFVTKTFKPEMEKPAKGQLPYKIAFSTLVALLLFVGIRGRLAHKSPIRVGTAYFSNNPFINQ